MIPLAPGRALRVLLTGFEPFVEGIPTNPSWDIVAPLDGRTVALEGREALVRAVRLPVAYGRAARALEEATLAFRPDAILSFGMHRRGAAIEVERRFRFAAREGEAQALGEAPSRSALLRSEAVVAALRSAGFEARTSDDAGLYVCEHTGFSAVGLARRLGIAVAGFVHVPAPAAVLTERLQGVPEVVLRAAIAPGR